LADTFSKLGEHAKAEPLLKQVSEYWKKARGAGQTHSIR
jgi:hypothetical protein